MNTHDLLRLRDPSVLRAATPPPRWLAPALRSIPWVVVRRAPIADGLIPVGVRGAARTQRFAALIALHDVTERLAPEDLRERASPVVALAQVAPILDRRGLRWGPGGSVGFALASGVPPATPANDLDLIIRQERRLAPEDARALLEALVEAAAPMRIDALLETPMGGVALAELAAAPARLLVRTLDGPLLCADPWPS